MGLEVGTYISDLNASNPDGATDQKSEGDDHIRLLKSTILATFPNISGAMNASHTELNYVVGVTSAIQTQMDLKAPLASPALTGNPTAPTQSSGDNSTKIATTAYVDALALGSKVLLDTQTASASAALEFVTGINSTYDYYEIHLLNMVPSANGAGLFFQLSNDTGSTWITTSTYYADGAGTTALKLNYVNNVANVGINSSTGGAGGLSGEIIMLNPASSSLQTRMKSECTIVSSSGVNDYQHVLSYAKQSAVETHDAFRLIPSSGTITSGVAYLYGVKKS